MTCGSSMLWARMRRAAVVAMWGGLLAACGGGGSEAPAPAPAPMPSGSTDCGLADFQASLMARVNQVRAAGATCGSKGAFPATGALAWNNLLTQAAAGHSQDMAAKNYFSHTSQDGRTFTQRIDATGYAWMNAGENIAAGQRTVDSVMNGWMNSPDHCENIMSNAFTEIGVACVPGTASNTYATYWTMDLGKPR